jgi:hypothetical protein
MPLLLLQPFDKSIVHANLKYGAETLGAIECCLSNSQPTRAWQHCCTATAAAAMFLGAVASLHQLTIQRTRRMWLLHSPAGAALSLTPLLRVPHCACCAAAGVVQPLNAGRCSSCVQLGAGGADLQRRVAADKAAA